MTPPRVPRPRLTKDEWEAELARAKGVMAADVESMPLTRSGFDAPGDCEMTRVTPPPMVTRTGRRRSWWMRGWKR